MRKKIALLIATVCAVAGVLTGCAPSGVVPAEKNVQDIVPNIVEIGNKTWDAGYFYIVDKNTGVVYLGYDSNYRFGITAALNADGTPITAEQLGIEY